MTIYLTTEQVISIHDLESADPLRDAAALDAAVNASRATWDTHPLHPTVYEQAGVLLRDICQAQAFVNGNKRTAWISTDVFLQLNALRLADIRAEDIAALLRGISVADIDLTAAARWLQHHTQPRTRPCGGRRSPSDGPRPHERDNP